jgi:spore coat assembly protein SafA
MSITVQSRFLRVRDCLGEEKASAILQDTLELAGEYPDVERVIAALAVPRSVEAVCGEGRVVVRGAVDLRLLYEARPEPHDHDEDDEHDRDHDHDHQLPRLILADFREVCPFEVAVEFAGAAPGLKCRAMVTLESVHVTPVNRRRLGCDVALVTIVRVWEDQEVRAACECVALPPSRIRLVRELTRVEHLMAEGTIPLRLELSLAIPDGEPPVGDLLWAIPRGHHLLGRCGEGKGFVEGLFDVDVVYLTGDPDAPVRSFSWPDAHRFAVASDLPGAHSGLMLLVELDLEEVYGAREDDHCFTVTIAGTLRLVARQTLDLPLLTDVVSETGEPLDVVRKAVRCPQHLPEGQREVTVGGVLSLPPTKPPVGCVIRTGVCFLPDQVVAEEDRVLVEGDLSLDLLYQAADSGCQVHRAEFPRAFRLSQVVELPGVRPGMMAYAQVSAHTVACRLVDPETIKVEVVLKIQVKARRVVQVEVVVECLVVSPCPPGTTLRLVIVQPGDTLWKFSRRYGVPLDELIRANPQLPNPDLIYPGQRVRIPCAPLVPPPDP